MVDIQFKDLYRGKTVLLTGHTGFKGSWLALWLMSLGARVVGYSKDIPTEPSHFKLLGLNMESVMGDIRDLKHLQEVCVQYKPDIVFHLAAQPLVRYSYHHPVETYETNVMGTIHVFEAVRLVESVKAMVVITSDKVYDNKEWSWGYRENDALGGLDPYSSSKGVTEMVTHAYRHSFFNMQDYQIRHQVLIASCRSGNVIGGGDWALDRLVPDLMVAASKGESVHIRSPQATRPWQHVLEALSGYLLVGQRLLEQQKDVAEAWNFGPREDESFSVKEVAELTRASWDKISYSVAESAEGLHEAHLLKLDCSKARRQLGWGNVWDTKTAVGKTTEWFKSFYMDNQLLSVSDLQAFISDAKRTKQPWISH